MTDHPKFAAVRFGSSGPTYDYIAPFPVAVGDVVWAESRRGKVKVTVAELKDESELATASLIEKYVEPAADEAEGE